MNIVIIDDEQYALSFLMKNVSEVCPDSMVTGFRSHRDALAYITSHLVHVAFLDIHMPEINGLELAKRIKEVSAKTNIIFVTAYSEYAVAAHGLYVAGYLMKPAAKEDILEALRHLRSPVELPKAHIRVRTFGGFDVFVDGKPLDFGRSKSKELLAYLVDRKGVVCTMAQIIAAIWEDAPITRTQKSHLRNLIAEMMAVLKKAGAEDLVIKSFHCLRIDTTKFSCDYYDFLSWKPDGINTYTGEYMPEYSWAEFTLGMPEQRNHLSNKPSFKMLD